MQLLHTLATAEDYDHAARVWAAKAGFWAVVAMVVGNYGTWWALLPGAIALMRAVGSVSCARESERIRQRYASMLN